MLLLGASLITEFCIDLCGNGLAVLLPQSDHADRPDLPTPGDAFKVVEPVDVLKNQRGMPQSGFLGPDNLAPWLRGCLKSDEMCRLARKDLAARHIRNGVSP